MRLNTVFEGMILTDRNLKPIAMDRNAELLLADYIHKRNGSGVSFPLPDEVVMSLKGKQFHDLPSETACFQVGRHRYICRVSVLRSNAPPAAGPLLALSIHKQFNSDEAMRRIARKYDLTDREREALRGIFRGLTCKEVAQDMHISPNTVKTFMRGIMMKMGVSRRAGLISKVFEQNDLNC